MRILFLTHRLPYAPNRGDRVRAYHLLRELVKWADVDLVSLVHDAEEESHVRDLSGLASLTTRRVSRRVNALRAAAAWPTRLPATHALLRAPGLAEDVARLAAINRPDVVLCYCTGVAPLALTPALRDVPLVLDMVDVDSAKWASLARTSPPPRSWIYAREAQLLLRFERDIASRARVTFVVTDKERDSLQPIAPDARIEVVGNGIDADRLRRPDSLKPGDDTVVFCGVMNYAPNVEGVQWFARNVWPLVRQQLPNARLEIVGSHPTRSVRDLANAAAGVVVAGHVPDVAPHLWNAAVSVAPLHTARGVQNKVLEAVAAGLPSVVTSVVADGLPREVREACVTADSAPDFAAAVVSLLRLSPDERRAIVARANLAELSWERRLASVRRLLTEAASDVRSSIGTGR